MTRVDVSGCVLGTTGHLVVAHVLAVPVVLQPVLRRVLLDEVVDPVPEVVGLQQQQLDDEVAHLGLVALVAAHRLRGEGRATARARGRARARAVKEEGISDA